MRLLYVIDSLAGGGAESSLAALAPKYVGLGIDVEIAYLRSRPGLEVDIDPESIPLFCLEGPGGRIGSVARVKRLIEERQPDLVHTTLFEADVAGRVAGLLARVPVVSSLVNIAYGREQFADPDLRRWKVRAAQAVDAITARSVVRFHAVSNHVADVMSRRLVVSRKRIDVISRGRDPQALGTRDAERIARVRREFGEDPDVPLVLAAARQEHQKGLDVLIDAWPRVVKRVPNAHLLLAGREGNKTDRLESDVKRYRLEGSLRFLGARSDVPDLLAACDVFVAPSRWEGLGGVVVEAIGLATPVVATSIPAIEEVVTHGRDALLVEPEDPVALADAIVRLLSEPETAASLAASGRARFVERYTIDRIADEMLAFYERALSNSQ